MDVSNRSRNALRILKNGTRSIEDLIKRNKIRDAAQVSARVTGILKTISKQHRKRIKFD